jgi:hypothetical protein
VALDAPLSVTLAPPPPVVGLSVPEIVNVGAATAVAVKFKPVILAAAIVVDCDPGLNVNPLWLGVTEYVPAASPVKV